MTERAEQWICIKFCVKLEHSSTETIPTIQKAAAVGNGWLTASSSQHVHSCITSCAEFFGETSNHPGDSAPYSLDLVPCDFWLFPKLKSLKGKRLRPLMRFGKIQRGSWWRLGELCEVPRCLLWRGLSVIVLCTVFLLSFIFFGRCLVVHACAFQPILFGCQVTSVLCKLFSLY